MTPSTTTKRPTVCSREGPASATAPLARLQGARLPLLLLVLLLLGGLFVSACSTSQHAAAERSVEEQLGSAEVADGGVDTQDPVATDATDAGELAQVDGESGGGGPSSKPTYMNDQLIVKIKSAPGVSAAALTAQVEEATGAAVDAVRVGPVGTFLVVFKPLDPPRDESQLDALQAALEATDAFEYVQRNRLYEAKGAAGQAP